jgi:SAM-dependent methyltransferase
MSLPWPWPAVLVWTGAWALHAVLTALGSPTWLALGLALLASVVAAQRGTTPWRRAFMALGFPLSWALLHGVGHVPAWAWLLLAAFVVVLYPPSVWRDAPWYPTPEDALRGLADVVRLPPMARVLDAGSGAGDGLRALAHAFPDARVVGIERSWPLVWLARWRCAGATVVQGDMWALDWSSFEVVYLFQRPESMPQALAKARLELRDEAWLVSLAFEVPGCVPYTTLDNVPGRAVWVYRGADL